MDIKKHINFTFTITFIFIIFFIYPFNLCYHYLYLFLQIVSFEKVSFKVKLNDHKIKIYTLIWLFIFVITNGYKFYIFKVDY